MNTIEQALDALSDDQFFERLCQAVLTADGYKIDPRGGSRDAGRDAIEVSNSEGTTIFQFSIQKDWRRKLAEEQKRYRAENVRRPNGYVFLTNQDVGSESKDGFIKEFAGLGINLRLLDRAWLSSQLALQRNSQVRNELLASLFQAIPDMLRWILKSPVSAAAFASLQPALTGALIDEKLKNCLD